MQPLQSDHQPLIFDNRDIGRYTGGERRQPMRGFDPQYTDIVDYIIRITETAELTLVTHKIHRRAPFVANLARGTATTSLSLMYWRDPSRTPFP